jgi:hypothetical protein
MSTEPEEYRTYARRCSELASESADPRLKQIFSELADAWAELAAEGERARSFMKY